MSKDDEIKLGNIIVKHMENGLAIIPSEDAIMSADEMFEKLGYKIATSKFYTQEECIIYKKSEAYIYFSLTNKCVGAFGEKMRYEFNKMVLIEMQELQAINKKCKELGWI